MEPSDVETLRYGIRARVRDTLLCAGLAVVAPVPVLVRFFGPPSLELYLAVVGAVLAGAVFVVARWRWSAWVRVDALGASAGNVAGDPVQQLGWSELQEIGLLTNGGLILRGEDVVVRLGPDLDGLEALRLRILRTWGPVLYRRRREDFRLGRTLEFHGPESPSWAATKAMLWVLCLGIPVIVAFWSDAPWLGLSFFAIFGGWMARRRIRACERIRVNAEGLEIRRVATTRIRWEDLSKAALLFDSRLALGGPAMGVVTVSPQISNFVVLQEIVLERVGKAPRGVSSA
jgi:hypothetical protein